MPMDASSYDAYQDLVSSGKVSKVARQVLITLLKHGPQTGQEVNRKLNSIGAHKRLWELEKKGLVERPNRAICSVTHKSAAVWIVNQKRLPSIPSIPINQISVDPEHLMKKQGIKAILDTKKGTSIYVAMVDELVMKAGDYQPVFDYCLETGIPMFKMRPCRQWTFHNPTAARIFDNEPKARKYGRNPIVIPDVPLFPESEN